MNYPTITTKSGRYYLTDRIREEVNFYLTQQNNGEPPPSVQKQVPKDVPLIRLPEPGSWDIPDCDLQTAIANRQSHRSFTPAFLSLDELAFLLWSTQGVRKKIHDAAVLRTVPSAGCRHPFETYLAIQRVDGFEQGIYRYLPLDHALVCLKQVSDLAKQLTAATHGQRFAGQSAVAFIWTVIPSRTEWRYAEASYKVIALDAGHVCQNLYLACEAVGAGTCAIAAYDQTLADELVDVDGDEEFVIYISPVGKVIMQV
jgi:SagB-type dehydrogenase family enzyme